MQDVKEMNSLSQEEMDKIKLQQKREILHKGPCSSPRNVPGDAGCLRCTCPKDCPLHGRCCDCIAHHKLERLEMAERGMAMFDPKWMPHCIAWFDERNGVNCEADPEAGSRVMTQEDFQWIQQEGMKHMPPPVPGEAPRQPTKYDIEQMLVVGERMLRERDRKAADHEAE